MSTKASSRDDRLALSQHPNDSRWNHAVQKGEEVERDRLTVQRGSEGIRGSPSMGGAGAGDFTVQILAIGENARFISKNPGKGKVVIT
jgi:hypothetical protein